MPRALPARYVPPSGFDYPLDGLLPPSPCRFFFTPAALMGFTLRSSTSQKVSETFPQRIDLPTVSPAVVPNAVATGRPGRTRFLGLDPPGRSCRPGMGLARRQQETPMGSTLLGYSGDDLDRNFARSPPTCFSNAATNHHTAAPWSIDQSSLGPALSPQRTAIMGRTTLLGSVHRLSPEHASKRSPGL